MSLDVVFGGVIGDGGMLLLLVNLLQMPILVRVVKLPDDSNDHDDCQ